MRLRSFGDIRWSDGHGRWNLYDDSSVCKRGYWVKKGHGRAEFIGCNWEEAMLAVTNCMRSIIRDAEHQMETAIRKFEEFEAENKLKVLDHIVAELDREDSQ
jgi:hypothetical protein